MPTDRLCRDCGEPWGDAPGICRHCAPCHQAWPARRAARVNGPTCLYRLHDRDGRLLYVGTTIDPARRYREHSKEKPWWHLVDRTVEQWLPDAAEARRAEGAAVREELPLLNTGFYCLPGGPDLPEGVPPQPPGLGNDFTDNAAVEAHRRAWLMWWAVLRDHWPNPEEAAALGRSTGGP
ncbi:GIY-YIG nuclease family protein [Streptomyces sp. NPDC059506]|uniref:GIY-YIG nuclease family protein n=1 Tax=Streptomyces sp. NPDC059506 TaxID=3347751 RepID=UPI00367938A8